MKVEGELVVARYRRQVPPNMTAIRMLTKGKTARDGSDDGVAEFFKNLKPKNIFDTVAENDKRRKDGNCADD